MGVSRQSTRSRRQTGSRRQAGELFVGTMSDVIGEVRGEFGRREQFRRSTAHLQRVTTGPLIVSVDGVKFAYKRQVLKDEGNVANVTRDSEGKIMDSAVGDGKRVTVREELTLTRDGTTVFVESETTTLHTIDRIGARTSVAVEQEQGSMTVTKDGIEKTTSHPEEARISLKEFY